jgi:DNA-directed RNA polymerase specialized sigma24 family protein
MARSFGLDRDDAHDLVQDMYLRLHQYVDNPEKLEYGDDDVNTFFVYVTMRNMYLREITQKARIKFVSIDEFDDKEEVYNVDSDQALTALLEVVHKEVNKWDWYDNKLFTIYHDGDISLRKLSDATKISLRSIYNTLKNGKDRIKTSCDTEYQAWAKAKGIR